MLIGQLTHDRRGLQMALPQWHAREMTTQLSPDIQRHDTLVLCEGVQQCRLAGIGLPDEQDELVVQRANLVNELFEFFQHGKASFLARRRD
jgi:hypothetical protein